MGDFKKLLTGHKHTEDLHKLKQQSAGKIHIDVLSLLQNVVICRCFFITELKHDDVCLRVLLFAANYFSW